MGVWPKARSGGSGPGPVFICCGFLMFLVPVENENFAGR